MDNGEVIQGLDEQWTLGGARMNEWIAGFTMMLLVGSMFFAPIAKHGPHLLVTCALTTFGLAALRRSFPDEERGIRNAAMTALGISPPGIPAPAILQPYWSGMPLRELRESCEYVQLGLAQLFVEEEPDFSAEQLHSSNVVKKGKPEVKS